MTDPGLIGAVLDRYVVEEVLGRGGMAVVYRVLHRQLGTHHALKVLTVHGSGVRQRLLQEGRVQAALQHPNIVSVTDVIDVDGSPGIVMELVRGPSLEQLLADQELSLAQCDHIAAGLLRGVEAAHRAGLVHRDLKPGNVLIAVTSDGLLPKVADFGLAKILEADPASAVQTRSGVTMGTPAYMAPEQVRNARGVDARADIFALGAILYEMVTARRAFDGEDVFEIFTKIANGQVIPVRTLRPNVPDRMERAISSALQVDRDARIATAAALLSVWQGAATTDSSGGFDLQRLRAKFSAPTSGAATGAGAERGASSATFDNTDATPPAVPGRAQSRESRAEVVPRRSSIGAVSSIEPDVQPVLAPTSYPPEPGGAESTRSGFEGNSVPDNSRLAYQPSARPRRVEVIAGMLALLVVGTLIVVSLVAALAVGGIALVGTGSPSSDDPAGVVSGPTPRSAPTVVQELPPSPVENTDPPTPAATLTAAPPAPKDAAPPRDAERVRAAPSSPPPNRENLESASNTRSSDASVVRVDRKGDAPEVWLVEAGGSTHQLPSAVSPGVYTIRARFADLAPEDTGTISIAAGDSVTVTCSRLLRRCQ